MKIKTYITDTKYDINGEVTYTREFSEGEFLTEEDFDLISDRSHTFYVEDGIDAEEFYSTYIPEANLSPRAYQYDDESSFKIGNNIAGGI